MRLGFHGVNSLHDDLSMDIQFAGQSGFDVLEIWAPKLIHWLLRGGTLPGVWEQMRPAGLTAHTLGPIEDITFGTEADWADVRRLCHGLSAAAGFLQIPWVPVTPSRRPSGLDDAEVRDHTVSVLSELSDIAGGYGGVGLALEFGGSKDCSVRTLGEALAVVHEAARPNVAVVLDTFHFHTGGSSLDSVAELDPDRLAVVQASDGKDQRSDELQDAYRLLPGKGDIPIGDILSSVLQTGWDGVLSVEARHPEYWEWSGLQLARQAKIALEAVV